jgi:hypothetical protein
MKRICIRSFVLHTAPLQYGQSYTYSETTLSSSFFPSILAVFVAQFGKWAGYQIVRLHLGIWISYESLEKFPISPISGSTCTSLRDFMHPRSILNAAP